MGLDLVVTCTKRKRYVADPTLHIGALHPSNVTDVALEWLETSSRIEKWFPACEMYAGAGWQFAQQAFGAGGRLAQDSPSESRLLIISAGFGLVQAQDRIPSYEATFASGANQIGSKILCDLPISKRHQTWWSTLNSHRMQTSTPLAEQVCKKNKCLIVASMDYIDAIIPDLMALASMRDRNNLYVVSIGTDLKRLPDALKPYFLPVAVSIEHLLGGTRSTINQQVAHWLLNDIVPKVGWAREKVDAVIHQAIADITLNRSEKIVRLKLDDLAIMQWLATHLRTFGRCTQADLLHKFRQSGYACEQQRFAHLYQFVAQTEQVALEL